MRKMYSENQIKTIVDGNKGQAITIGKETNVTSYTGRTNARITSNSLDIDITATLTLPSSISGGTNFLKITVPADVADKIICANGKTLTAASNGDVVCRCVGANQQVVRIFQLTRTSATTIGINVYNESVANGNTISLEFSILLA